MSQNRFYIAPNENFFQLVTSKSHGIVELRMERQSASVLHSSRPIEALSELETTPVTPSYTQQWTLISNNFNVEFFEQLTRCVTCEQWSISGIDTIVGMDKFTLALSHSLDSEQQTVLAALCEQYRIDLNLKQTMPTLNQPGLVVLDMDSTSITIECIDEIAKLADVGEQVAQITELAMQGKLDFSQSLRSRVSKLAGIEVSLLDRIANDLPLMPGMETLVAQFKAHDWRVAIASGGFTYFADTLKSQLSLDDAVSNTLAIANGKLTGEVEGKIVDAKVKAETVEALAEKYGISMSQTIAIGDGANDLQMMNKAALGIAFHAKPLVQEQADTAINYGDLSSVITLLAR